MTSKNSENPENPQNLPQGIDQVPESPEVAQKFAPERQELAKKVTTDSAKSSTDALSEEMKDKAKLLALMEEDEINFKTVEDIEKATERYGDIMDKWGLDVVLGWFWWETASGIFSTLFFLYQWQKLPDGKKLPMIDVLKVFGLQLVDVAGTATAKVVWTWWWAVAGGIIGTLLIPMAGTVAGALVWWALWYTGGSSLFDYFFKANKWSADIFKKHCDNLRNQAQARNNTALVEELTVSAAKIEDKFSAPAGKKAPKKPEQWWNVIPLYPESALNKAA